MTNKKDNSIPVSEVATEWFKNPKFVAAYDALEDEFAEIRQQMLAKRARRQRRAVLVARVHESARGFWLYIWRHCASLYRWLTRGVTRLAPS